jgi:hypothetical protein
MVSFTPQSLYPQGKSPSAHWIGGWVGPRTGLNNMEKRKILPLPGFKLPPVASCYTNCTIPVHNYKICLLLIFIFFPNLFFCGRLNGLSSVNTSLSLFKNPVHTTVRNPHYFGSRFTLSSEEISILPPIS